MKLFQKTVGYHSVSICDFTSNSFDCVTLLDIVKVIEKEKGLFNPGIIFTNHGVDLNIVHQRSFEAVIKASKTLVGEKLNNIIVTFETPSSPEWRIILS